MSASRSLPLMGIRNHEYPGRDRPFAELTTPHGDQERHTLRGADERDWHSLPLMGIRNPHEHRETALRNIRLTTPHGDQERARGNRARRANHPHYPSWGSGTECISVDATMNTTSLPLMGIRNASVSMPHQARRTLTTPHGDQELSRQSPTTPATRAHYPSWGSGTGPGFMGTCGPRHPHYPSWGSGTRKGHRRASPPDRPHYPSWGSGTPVVDVLVQVLRALTTPHGDQERHWSGLQPSSPPAHYPSWGSGTSWLCPGLVDRLVKLPVPSARSLLVCGSRGSSGDVADCRTPR